MFELLKIVRILYTEKLHTNQLAELQISINYFHKLLSKVHGFSFKPKFHHLSHYPSLIGLYGPIHQYSTKPYERKHRPSKAFASRMCNHLTPAVSLMKRNLRHTINELDRTGYLKQNFSSKLPTHEFVNSLSELNENGFELVRKIGNKRKIFQTKSTGCRKIISNENFFVTKSFWEFKKLENEFVFALGNEMIITGSKDFYQNVEIGSLNVYVDINNLHHQTHYISKTKAHNMYKLYLSCNYN